MRHRGPDEPGTWHDERCRPRVQPAVDHRHRAQPPAAALGPAGEAGPLRPGLQRRDLQLPRAARASWRAEHGAVFATDGDGEAIVAAYHHWGTDALSRLRGMFAFAIWDTRERNCSAPAIRSASSRCSWRPGPAAPPSAARRRACWNLPTIVGIDLGIDERAVQHYTVLQYVPEPETLHRGIRRLESGSYARVRPGRPPEVTRYFTPRFAADAVRRGRRSRAATTRSPRCSRIRSPSTCAPTSPSARSCPAASTPPRSPRWRCGTTRS